MSKLIIDQGNTLIKVALFEGDNLVKKGVLNSIQDIGEWMEQASSAILSSVGDDNILKLKLSDKEVLILNSKTPVPIVNRYHSKNTLGNDRLAAMVAANSMFPNSCVLVIDVGTCITFDLINDKKEYLGGSISPGLNMKINALNNQTFRLPLIELQKNVPLIGDDTEKSILSGVVNGTLVEIDGLISCYKEQYPKLKIIMTGGDLNFFDKGLKNTIFADPNLVFKGLNNILRYNEKNI